MTGKRTLWERLGREVAFEGRVVDVWQDRVRIAHDGESREAVYDVVHHPGAVAVVPLFDDGTIAMLRQFRYATGGYILEIPAGTLEEGESFESCAVRELAEEIGCRAARWSRLAHFYTTPGFCDEEMRIYLAEGLTDAGGTPDEDELLEVVHIVLAEAVERAARGEIQDAKTLIGLHTARARLEAEGRWPPGPP